MLALLGHANATVSTLLPLSTKCFLITCVALNTPLLIIAFLIVHPGTSGLLSSPIQSPNLPRQRPNHLPFNRHPTYSLSTSQVASSSMSSELRKSLPVIFFLDCFIRLFLRPNKLTSLVYRRRTQLLPSNELASVVNQKTSTYPPRCERRRSTAQAGIKNRFPFLRIKRNPRTKALSLSSFRISGFFSLPLQSNPPPPPVSSVTVKTPHLSLFS